MMRKVVGFLHIILSSGRRKAGGLPQMQAGMILRAGKVCREARPVPEMNCSL